MRLVLLPSPGVMVQGVSVGKFQDAKAERITVAMDVFSLFAPVKVVNSITIEALSIKQDALGGVYRTGSSHLRGHSRR